MHVVADKNLFFLAHINSAVDQSDAIVAYIIYCVGWEPNILQIGRGGR